eukprot:284817290_5
MESFDFGEDAGASGPISWNAQSRCTCLGCPCAVQGTDKSRTGSHENNSQEIKTFHKSSRRSRPEVAPRSLLSPSWLVNVASSFTSSSDLVNDDICWLVAFRAASTSSKCGSLARVPLNGIRFFLASGLLSCWIYQERIERIVRLCIIICLRSACLRVGSCIWRNPAGRARICNFVLTRPFSHKTVKRFAGRKTIQGSSNNRTLEKLYSNQSNSLPPILPPVLCRAFFHSASSAVSAAAAVSVITRLISHCFRPSGVRQSHFNVSACFSAQENNSLTSTRLHLEHPIDILYPVRGELLPLCPTQKTCSSGGIEMTVVVLSHDMPDVPRWKLRSSTSSTRSRAVSGTNRAHRSFKKTSAASVAPPAADLSGRSSSIRSYVADNECLCVYRTHYLDSVPIPSQAQKRQARASDGCGQFSRNQIEIYGGARAQRLSFELVKWMSAQLTLKSVHGFKRVKFFFICFVLHLPPRQTGAPVPGMSDLCSRPWRRHPLSRMPRGLP